MKDHRTLIIAEAGVNHNGSFEIAKELINKAAEAGVDYIKFQTFRAENLVIRNAPKAEYQKQTTETDESQFEMLKKLELSRENYRQLNDFATQKGIKFLSSAFDLESVDFLSVLKPDLWKVPSGEITNYPYLRKIAGQGRPVLLSTGMSSVDDIEKAVDLLVKFGMHRDWIKILHCNTEYPTPIKDVNLNAMKFLKNHFNLEVGYSDHTEGIEIPIAAVAMGAVVIEKHFTLDRNMSGPDHRASLEPHALKEMVKAIRNIELAFGEESKKVTPSENKNRDIARKSIVASRDILKGEFFSEENLTTKRPGTGISPMEWERVIGKEAKKDFQADEFIEL